MRTANMKNSDACPRALAEATMMTMFAVLMILDMFFLMFLAYRYTPYNRNSSSSAPQQSGMAMETHGVANNNFKSDTDM